MNQDSTDRLFMDIAFRVAEESYCKRKQVGAILVKDNIRIISYGFNGTPSGEENCCEDENNVSKPNVIHAEDNVFRKLLKSPESSEGSTMYITLAPCERCTDLILDGGVTRVVYSSLYRCDKGLEKLERRGVTVDLLEPKDEGLDLVKSINEDTLESLKEFLKPMFPIQEYPVIPQIDPSYPDMYGLQCSKCGLKFDGVTGYVCPNSDCPVGLGGVYC